MFSPYIRFVLAGTLAVITTVPLLTTLDADGRTTPPAKALKAKVLRSHDKVNEKLSPDEIKLLRAQDGDKEERALEDKIPKHLPIRVKPTAAKEKEFKRLSNDHWLRNLELEVKNVGTRPIYYLVLIVDMPELKFADGNMLVDLRFGDSKFLNFAGGAKAEDPSIPPGETRVLKVEDPLDWSEYSRGMPHWPRPKQLVLRFQEINFGDGTGFSTTGGVPWPAPKKSSAAGACLESGGVATRTDRSWSKPQDAANSKLGGEPASILPGSFRYSANLAFLRSLEVSTSAGDPCCSGNCYNIYEYDSSTACYGFSCGSIRRADFVPCSDTRGRCATYEVRYKNCTVYEDGYRYTHQCQYAVVSQCSSSPTPGPTPEATPTASPTPLVILSPGPTGGTGDETYYWYCTEYYWLYYVSFDGGKTWHYDHMEYAGCF